MLFINSILLIYTADSQKQLPLGDLSCKVNTWSSPQCKLYENVVYLIFKIESVCLLNLSWEPVPQERASISEGSASHSTFENSRNHK